MTAAAIARALVVRHGPAVALDRIARRCAFYAVATDLATPTRTSGRWAWWQSVGYAARRVTPRSVRRPA